MSVFYVTWSRPMEYGTLVGSTKPFCHRNILLSNILKYSISIKHKTVTWPWLRPARRFGIPTNLDSPTTGPYYVICLLWNMFYSLSLGKLSDPVFKCWKYSEFGLKFDQIKIWWRSNVGFRLCKFDWKLNQTVKSNSGLSLLKSCMVVGRMICQMGTQYNLPLVLKIFCSD